MHEVNAQALHVVATELGATLGDVRAALEAAAERPGDPAPLAQVADLLRQTRGVLRVVEVYGGALLAEEMEQTARFMMRGGDARQQAEGLDALVRSVVQLPTYLERVLSGGRDLALVLLPLLNDLRSVRGASLLSEGTLLSLNLKSDQQPEPREPAPGEPSLSLAQWARRLRPRFQVALLGLIRGERPAQHIDGLAEVAERIESVATTGPVFQLWWVVGAVLEALKAGGLDDSASVKRLLGQADRELRRLYELGEERYAEQPPLELLNNLLFYVARASGSGPRVAAVRSSFRLTELLPVDESVEQERESLSAPSVKLMHTVAAAIKEDLGRVKDALDLFTRKGGQPEELGPQVDLLKKIGDTLAVLGLGSLREQVQAELGRLADVVARRVPTEGDTLIGIAAALITVEDSLDESLVKLIMPPGAPATGLNQDPEFRQVAEAVLRECSVNIARIKELVAQALEPGADIVGIDSVPPLARGVTAGLLMLGKTRATEVMARASEQILRALARIEERPSLQVIDRLADAVVSIEYYIETLQAGRGDPWYMLDNAERCLAAVEARTGTLAPEAAADEAPETTLVIERPVFAEPAPAVPAGEVTAAPAKPAEAIPPEPVAAPAAAELPAALPVAAAAEQPDPELVAVFIEEAREEAEAIRGMLPLWAENPADNESLVRVRRAFHTLKGSGRMVGATTIGEFAWSVENLLNRIIDGTRSRSPQVVALLREAAAAVPGLIEALETGRPAHDSVGGLAQRVHALAEGRELPEEPVERRPPEPAYEPTMMVETLDEVTMARMLESVPPVDERAPEAPAVSHEMAASAEEPAGETPAQAPREAGPEEAAATIPAITAGRVEPAETPAEPGLAPEPEPEREAGLEGAFPEAMDPSLQDIYRREVQSHLDVLRDFLRRAWTSPGPYYVTEELYRACHTLRGASRTAESRHSVRLADPLHRWLRRLFDHDRPFDDEGLATLADTVSAFEDVLDNINEDSSFFTSLKEVIGRISALDLALEQALAAPPPEQAEPEATQAEAPGEPASGGIEPAPQEETFKIDHLIPGITLESGQARARPGAGFDRLLPPGPELPGVEGEVPYLGATEPSPPEAPTVPAQEAMGVSEPGEPTGISPEQVETPPGLRLPSVIEEVARAEAEAAEAEVTGTEPLQEPAALVEPEAERPAEPEPEAVAPPASVPAAPSEELAPAGDVEYDADIAAIFCEEATELLEASDGALGALRAERGSRERVVELQRALHTLKGGARMAGIRAMGDLSHELESFLIQVSGGAVPLEDRSFEVMQASLDELNRMRDFVNAGRPVVPARDLITRIRLVASGATPVPVVEPSPPPPTLPEPGAVPEPGLPPEHGIAAAPEPTPDEGAVPVSEAEPPAAIEPLMAEPAGVESQPEPAEIEAGPEAVSPHELPPPSPEPQPQPLPPGRELAAERAEMARVDADLLDAMLNNAGEVSIFRSRLEQQLSSVEFNLAELGRVVQRLKEQLRKLEMETEAQILHRHEDRSPQREDFDPLELDRYSSIQQYSRALGETASDVGSVQGLLENLTREAQNLLQQQGRVVSDLQNGLMRTRMVPFQRHVQRLTRIVRQAAAESGKRAELTVAGAAGELDRQVLERMLPPFEHLLRNAVVHGIELPSERAARGKPETGRIELALKREGAEVVITVSDDGAGINLRAVRDKAVGLGIVSPRQDLSDEQAIQLILEPGFSTAGKVTQSAGRGVGMDVVATEIKKLGGALFIESEEGRGTRFTARLPFTLAISQALVVRAGEEFFALPLPTVEGVVRVPAAEVRRLLAEDAAGFEYGGQRYRFRHLTSFVGGQPAAPADHDPAVPVILVRAGEHSTGIVTDELIGSREIVVKSIGPQIAGIRGISGATILGDGRICIILDVGALVRSDWRSRSVAEPQPQERADRRAFALVVDDSITVRRVTQRLLERNGLRVMTAKDGLDAIGVLQDHLPDVILLDIEMPRMDGYEVASHVRNDPRLKDVPIVMITSRVGEKHRARAIELGVNDYLGKPYQETQLLQALEPLLRRRRAS